MDSTGENKDERGCSCHPDEAITPCPKQHALWHCQHEAVLRGTHMIVPIDALRKAKADGYREGAREFTEEPNHSEPIIEARASQIEKGN